jgi:hypothetical protein
LPGDDTVQRIEDVPILIETTSSPPTTATNLDITWEGDESDGNTCPETITAPIGPPMTVAILGVHPVDHRGRHHPAGHHLPGRCNLRVRRVSADFGDATASDCDEDADIDLDETVSPAIVAEYTIQRVFRHR